MGFLKQLFFSSCLVLSVLGCGSKISPRLAPEVKVTGLKVASTVLTDINEIDHLIPEISSKPRIFIFASELCAVCQSEHRALRDLMGQHSGLLPNNIELFTIMVGAENNLDALGFKDATNIQWDPFYQNGDQLRTQLCGQGTANPCVVIELPGQGIVLQRLGEVSLSELQVYTGVWVW